MTPAARRLLLAVVVLCGLVRVAHLLAVYQTPLFAAHRVWPATDMYAFDQWAQQIVDGDVLGDPPYRPVLEWMAQAAPPAQWARWLGDAPVFYTAPLYAYLVALVRWLFGDPALPMAVLQLAVSMASAMLVFLVTECLFGSGAAVAAALLFAVYGPAVHYDVVMLRGPLVVLVSLLVSWCLLRMRARITAARAGILGLVVGVSVLLNEGFATLALLVPLVVASWAPSRSRGTVAVGAFLAGVGIALAPLAARNIAVGAPPLQTALQGAVVFAFSNASDSNPSFFGFAPPSFAPLMEASEGRLARIVWLCFRSFDGVGAMASFYLRRAAGLIEHFENAVNAIFYYATIQSPLLRWLLDYAWLFPVLAMGIVLALGHGRRRLLVALVPVSLALLVANLIAPPLSRYRLPLIVLWMPCAGLAIERLWSWMRQRRVVALGGAVTALIGLRLVADLVERRVVLAGNDPWTHVYRMADFSVAATEYERQGRYREASREYLALASHVPRGSRLWVHARFLAAPLQLRAGDDAGARASADDAAELAPADAGVLLAIGDLYWKRLGDPAAGARMYRRAAEVGATGPLLQILQARLSEIGAPAPPVTPPGTLR